MHAEFSKMFDMKLANFGQEIMSVLLTPFILCFSLPRSAPAIIDFMREFTVHVDGIGYVCSFAVFDFKRNGRVQEPVMDGRRQNTRSLLGHNAKMEKSFLHFKVCNFSIHISCGKLTTILAHRLLIQLGSRQIRTLHSSSPRLLTIHLITRARVQRQSHQLCPPHL